MHRNNKHPQPLIYLRGVKTDGLQAVMEFIYLGEVNVFQDDLNNFLNSAKDFELKGLNGDNTGSTKTEFDYNDRKLKTFGQEEQLGYINSDWPNTTTTSKIQEHGSENIYVVSKSQSAVNCNKSLIMIDQNDENVEDKN